MGFPASPAQGVRNPAFTGFCAPASSLTFSPASLQRNTSNSNRGGADSMSDEEYGDEDFENYDEDFEVSVANSCSTTWHARHSRMPCPPSHGGTRHCPGSMLGAGQLQQPLACSCACYAASSDTQSAETRRGPLPPLAPCMTPGGQ